MQEQPRDFHRHEEGVDDYDFGPGDVLGDYYVEGGVLNHDFGPEATGVATMTPAGGASSGGDPPPLPYSEANSADPDDVNVIVDGIKVPYDVKDPVYWFRRLEVRMQTVGIGSQFWKRVALEQNLPPDLCACIKEYLILEQSEASTVYSDCKKTILEIYGPKP